METLQEPSAERKPATGQALSSPVLARAIADWQQAVAGVRRAEAAVFAALASAREAPGDRWLNQSESPLGKRAHCRACSSGQIEGARFVGRKWLAKASAIDAYITAHGRPATPASSPPANDVEQELLPDDEADIERELRAVGLTARRRRRA